jgi:hypothetical protein
MTLVLVEVAITRFPEDVPVVAKFVPSNVSADPVVRTLEPLRNATPLAVPPSNVTLPVKIDAPALRA